MYRIGVDGAGGERRGQLGENGAKLAAENTHAGNLHFNASLCSTWSLRVWRQITTIWPSVAVGRSVGFVDTSAGGTLRPVHSSAFLPPHARCRILGRPGTAPATYAHINSSAERCYHR